MTVAESSTRFGILGALEAWAGETRIRLSGAVQSRVLGTLLLERGRVLPVARLVDAAWDDEAPSTAAHQIRKAVADLRRRLPGGPSVLVTDGPGYRAEVGDRLDLARFESCVRRADEAHAGGELTVAVQALREGLALWRGPALSGLGGSVIEAAAVSLNEQRLNATERLVELRLRLGEAAELVAELRGLVQEHPLRENPRGHLMLALYRSGRQAEALDEYTRTRTLLVEQLGIEPGPALSAVYQAILRDAPEAAAPPRVPAIVNPAAAEPAARPTDEAAAAAAPCTLPMALKDFSGREADFGEVLRCGAARGIIAVDGMGGVGKTALMVRAAHHLGEQFPDGQLYVDLRGYADEEPLAPGAALDGLLRTVGVPPERVPEDLAGKSALWRTTVSGRRVLLLLDNAADAASVALLLPASPDCVTLVTSRTRLVGLDGAQWISLDVLSREDSAELIRGVLGAERVAAEPDAAQALARLCGDLPLALRLATARLRNRPRWTVQYLVDRLQDETRRLYELSAGERSVATTLRLSYQAMDAAGRRALRLLAVHPGERIDVFSAAALLDLDPLSTQDLLESLVDVHLLEQPTLDRYAFHDLVHNFAVGMGGGEFDAAGVPPAPGTAGATPRPLNKALAERLLRYYLLAAAQAAHRLFAGHAHRSSGIDPTTAALPAFNSGQDAQAWFAAEQHTLIACVGLAERCTLDRHAAALAREVLFWLNSIGLISEFAELSRTAVVAARRIDDPGLLGTSLSNLGVACWKLGLFDEGTEVAQEAYDLAARLGDRRTEAHSLGVLGLYRSLLGDLPQALDHLTEAIAIERELEIPSNEAESLTSLSALYEQWGRYEEAAGAARAACAIGRDLGERGIELVAVTDLAMAEVGSDSLYAASVNLERARQLCNGSNEPGHEAMALALSALVAARLGSVETAQKFAASASGLIEFSASPPRRAKVGNVLGQAAAALGDPERALLEHQRADVVAAAVSYRAEHAYALAGQASALRALGALAEAAVCAQRAAELFARLGVPPELQRPGGERPASTAPTDQ